MTDRPDALRLADELVAPIGTQSTFSAMQDAAACLRRQHAENIELRAKIEVAEAGYRAAVQRAQWQSFTNEIMNRNTKQKDELRAERNALLALLREVVSCFARDHDLPDSLLLRIHSAVTAEATKGNGAAEGQS